MSLHNNWMEELENELCTQDGKQINLLELLHEDDDNILNSWAEHIRSHYCSLEEIDDARVPMGFTRQKYLKEIKIPDKPMIKSGEFAEILIADFLQFRLSYKIPRTRYDNKISKNDSPKGSDVIGFKIINKEKISNKDELIICEVKAALSSKKSTTLEEAIKDSSKDFTIRKAESLHAIRQRLKEKGKEEEVSLVERFQNKVDRPYKEISGSAVVHSNHTWKDEVITDVTAEYHPNTEIMIVAIKGEKLMDLVHELYRRVCDEA
ncbi:MAG: Hachiman antiphage defense system protein HamA [Senegalia sp. (in: firmicutes)]|uniref:Hachiman antiphage defense system protein HamA n=1 Tax=Senegalia sp. (in: firmicutes) TaxID=1924098 RepID=UPI003F9AAD67